jgi:hypothetical protein
VVPSTGLIGDDTGGGELTIKVVPNFLDFYSQISCERRDCFKGIYGLLSVLQNLRLQKTFCVIR